MLQSALASTAPGAVPVAAAGTAVLALGLVLVVVWLALLLR
ncbi:MAG: hypothetical protein ABEJ42_06075 [Halobacteriaceae archaeon]